MTTLCMADYTGPPIRATEIFQNPKGLWAALKNRASLDEGGEIVGILQAISAYSPMVHHLIYDIACRDIMAVVSARREDAQLLARKQLARPQWSSLRSPLDQGATSRSAAVVQGRVTESPPPHSSNPGMEVRV